jgi:hypothetical protein
MLANRTAYGITTPSLTASPYDSSLIIRIVQALIQLARAIQNLNI